jgi:NAD(P)-dependent dehydrogenase (short-subunit alcohol dehydrogenase family)
MEGAAVIVTGGASGIGEACARQLGAQVVIADLQEDRGPEVASEIKGAFVRCDVSSQADRAAACTGRELGY